MSAEQIIQDLLTKHLGLEIKSVGSRSILAATTARASERRCDLDAYAMLVCSDPRELAALVDEVIVPESWFMRDRIPFTHLAEHARSVLRSRPGTFRVLSAPCSTGEEPYSVAMALLDAGIPRRQIAVDGIDVSPPLLETARRGVYRSISFRGEDLSFRGRHFEPARASDGTPTWLLSETVRSAVQFRQVNILAVGLLLSDGAYDAILCRNLLIYLTADARRTALAALDRVLAPDGLLITGHAESLEILEPRYRALPVAGAFTYRRRDELVSQPSARPLRPLVPVTPPLGMAKLSRAEVVPPPPTPPPRARDLLGEATALADRGELVRAGALCSEHLQGASSDAKAWTLLGTIRHASGESERAAECFHRALYCDPKNQTALLQLAFILDGRGDHTGAGNLRRRAAQASQDPR